LAERDDLTSLGYLGVDVVLDAHYGPLMLELNARPRSKSGSRSLGITSRLRDCIRK
jgi:hypothetical protein